MQNESYKAAGVDIDAGYRAVELMKGDIRRTHNSCVPEDIGGFGGLFIPDLAGMKEPVFVSGTDGVGTKLRIAQLLDKHDTVGIDLVAMCANDIICCGAKPLFFLDYIHCDKNIPEMIAAIVKGISDGCVEAGCALVGGETAEHPTSMEEVFEPAIVSRPIYEYDLAGFCVGVVDRSKLIEKKAKAGDALLGLASSGVHSNGFSLVRKVFNIISRAGLNEKLAKTLLTPTEIYVKPVLDLIDKIEVKGIAHITGGGFFENIPRCLPDGVAARVVKSSYQIPEIFGMIAERGTIPENDMYGTFNMGIGMVVAVAPENAHKAVGLLKMNNVKAHIIGEVINGDEGVVLV
ncbi:MAG: phosphoribosylformylglycinamidine cyclo-ligase [Oscillospiraceae bacterium]|nr:phosphoribosylformylglycinamidine cyclo-ligase [Oscillospiraceae bacterium]